MGMDRGSDRSWKSLLTREMHELVVARAEQLDEADRALITQAIDRGSDTKDVATLLGVSVRTVQRRLRSLILHLTSPRTIAVLRNQDRWPRDLVRVAMDVCVRRRTLRDTAARHGVTLHRVRRMLAEVDGRVDQFEAELRERKRVRRQLDVMPMDRAAAPPRSSAA